MADSLDIPYLRAQGGEYGCYMVPGASAPRPYAGIVTTPLRLTLAKGVEFTLTGVRVVDHGAPLFLLGADVLRAGRVGGWSLAGLRFHTTGEGEVAGSLEFEWGGRTSSAPLAHVPRAGEEKMNSAMVSHLQGPQGAQHLFRRYAG